MVRVQGGLSVGQGLTELLLVCVKRSYRASPGHVDPFDGRTSACVMPDRYFHRDLLTTFGFILIVKTRGPFVTKIDIT